MVLTDPQKISDYHSSYIVGELVKKGTIVSLKEYWSFQSSLYSTIITILVAINALVAAAVVFYIRGSSHEKAEEAAESYLKSEIFEVRLHKMSQEIAERSLEISHEGYADAIGSISEYNDEVSRLTAENERLDDEFKEIRQQLRIIANRIASNDKGDTEGESLHLSRGEH